MKKVSLWDGATNFQRAALFLLNRVFSRNGRDSVEKGRKQPSKAKGDKHGEKNSCSFNEKCYENLRLRNRE